MEKIEFCKKLKFEAEKIGCKLNEEQLTKFYKYMNSLIEWNEKINLTAITDPEEVITKHFIDSLTVHQYIKDNFSIVDVGTGAGFPGVPLAIVNNKSNITLVDSLNKRINFLKEITNQFELKNVQSIHDRAEEFGKDKQYRESFDIAISRAVARLNVLAEYLLPTVKVGGKCICMKGPDCKQEIEEAQNAIKVLGGSIERVEEFSLPDTDIKRTIIVINKVKNTPSKYPRKAGTPAKDPIK